MEEESPNRRSKHGFAAAAAADDDSFPLSSLPFDICTPIFLKLPFKSVICCKSVCKPWRQLLSDSEFVKLHLTHSNNNNTTQKLLLRSHSQSFYSIDYETSNEAAGNSLRRNFPFNTRRNTRIYGSSNGLLCVAIDHLKNKKGSHPDICLWNPSTGDYKMLPDANPLTDTGHGYNPNSSYVDRLVGFGYESFSRDYKMVRAIFRPRLQVDVYSLKTNSWKVIESITSQSIRLGFPIDVVGTAMNGTIYWLLANRQSDQLDRWIVGYDLKDNKFIELKLPPGHSDYHYRHPDNWHNVKLMVMGGSLGVYFMYTGGNPALIVLWMMNDDDQKHKYWTMVATLAQNVTVNLRIRFTNWKPVCLLEDGKLIFYMLKNLDSNGGKNSVKLLVYDTKEKRAVKKIQFEGITICNDLVVYRETLVSPNSILD